MTTLRNTLLLSSLLLSGCGWFSPDLPEAEDGFRHLFNGRNLDGWEVIGGGARFSVDKGDILGRHGPGDNTFLRSNETFGDFILTLEVKFEEPGNSGILFRAAQRPDGHAQAGRAFGYQYELDPSDRGWSGGIYDEARRGWLFTLEGNDKARSLLKQGDWNSIRIEAIGTTLKTWLNGEPVATLADPLDLEGFIALQVHSGESGVIRWRNIQIKQTGKSAFVDTGIRDPDFWEFTAGSQVETLPQGLRLSGKIRSRRQLGDFALRFKPATCPQPITLRLREQRDNEATRFAELILEPDTASLRLLPDGAAVKIKRANDDSIGIAASKGTLGIAIGEYGFPPLAGLPERGWVSVDASACPGWDMAGLEWIDGRPAKSKPDFYQTLNTPPAPVLSPEQALASFRVAPGFRVELVAEEPMVQDPVAMSWDEAGRLFVVEMRGFMPDAYGSGEDKPVGRVVMLEDTDGDGRMDERSIFMDGLVMPRALAVVNEGLLVAEPPTLWLCPNIAGKQRCENRRSLGAYAEDHLQASMEHLENGLMAGLDNWLYNAKSGRRLKLADGRLISEPTLARGQWGISMDDHGRLFYNTNSNFLSGDYYPAEALVSGPDQGPYPGLTELISTDDEVFSVRVNPGVNRAYIDGTLRPDGRLHKPTAVSGLAVYRGHQFPSAFHGDIFVPEPAANAVVQLRPDREFEVRAEHITYPDKDWGQREFLASSDERFRPVDVRSGPDGALYIIDMYRGIIQHKAFLTEELREQIFQRDLDKPINFGRIWRIVADAGSDPQPVRLNPADTSGLVKALNHPNGWVRDTAQRLLIGNKSADAVLQLRAVVANRPPRQAIHALWALQGRGDLRLDSVLSALSRDIPELQLHALRAGGELLSATQLLALANRWQDPDTALHQQWLFSLQKHNNNKGVQSALHAALAIHSDNRYLSIAGLQASRGAEAALLGALLSDATLRDSDTIRTVLSSLTEQHYIALRQAGDDAGLAHLLGLARRQTGDAQWRQLALLDGLAGAARRPGFSPWELAIAPALFSDSDIDESSPLWKARLSARRAMTWPGDEIAAGIEPLGPRQLALMQQGQRFYPACAGCHGNNGEGTAGLAPPLAGSEWTTGAPEWLARIILDGLSGPITVINKEWNGVMPGHRANPALDDATLAGLMTYLRRSWGHTADPVDTAMAAQFRADSDGRNRPWTVADLALVPVATGLEDFVGQYKISFVTFTVTEENGSLLLSVPMYGGGAMEDLGDGRFAAAAGGESIELEFPRDENGRITHALLHRQGTATKLKKVQ